MCLFDHDCCAWVPIDDNPWECYECKSRNCSYFTNPEGCLSNAENCHWDWFTDEGLCLDGPTECKDLESSDICRFYSGRLDCCWDYGGSSCSSCSTYCPTVSAFVVGLPSDNCAGETYEQCCLDLAGQSCESCNNYESCDAAGTDPFVCNAGASRGCCFVNDKCTDCSSAMCYELDGPYCELNEECCYDYDTDIPVLQLVGNDRRLLQNNLGCRRCDNCTEGEVNYKYDSCLCFKNEEDCCVADIEYERNCVWHPGNDTVNGTCADRIIVPAPTYLGMCGSCIFNTKY